MEFYRDDYVTLVSSDGEGRVVDVDNSGANQMIKVAWKYGDVSMWKLSRYFRLIERGNEYGSSYKEGEEVLVHGMAYPEAVVIDSLPSKVQVVLKNSHNTIWCTLDQIERPKKGPQLPNTIGSQVIVHKHVWTLLPKYLTWLNGTYVPGVAEEDLLWIYTPNQKEKSLEYIKQPDIARFTWTLVRDAGLDN